VDFEHYLTVPLKSKSLPNERKFISTILRSDDIVKGREVSLVIVFLNAERRVVVVVVNAFVILARVVVATVASANGRLDGDDVFPIRPVVNVDKFLGLAT